MSATPETGRPVSPAELPEAVTCALTVDGHLGHEDRWQLERFRRFLADKTAVKAEYADTLGPLTGANALAPFGPMPVGSADDPELARLWRERASRLRALIREYDADTQPEPSP